MALRSFHLNFVRDQAESHFFHCARHLLCDSIPPILSSCWKSSADNRKRFYCITSFSRFVCFLLFYLLTRHLRGAGSGIFKLLGFGTEIRWLILDPT